jgi:hypothetical protein
MGALGRLFGLEVPVPYRAVPRSREVSAIEEARRILDQAGVLILKSLRLLGQVTRPPVHAAPRARRRP